MKSPNDYELKSLGDMSTRVSYMMMDNIIRDGCEYPKYPNYRISDDMVGSINSHPSTRVILDHRVLFEALVSDKLMHRLEYMVDEGFGVFEEDKFIPVKCDEVMDE